MDKFFKFLSDCLNYLLECFAVGFVLIMEFLDDYWTFYGHFITWFLCSFVIPVLPYLPGGGWLLDFLLWLLYWDTWQRVFVISLLWLATWRYVRQRPFFDLDLSYWCWRFWYWLRRKGPPPWR